MDTKIIVAILLIFMIVVVSGCVQTDDGTGSSNDQADQASEQEIVDSLEDDIIDETETIDIGELV